METQVLSIEITQQSRTIKQEGGADDILKGADYADNLVLLRNTPAKPNPYDIAKSKQQGAWSFK